jgi:hypothetical protein
VELYAVRERRGGPRDWTRGLREQAGFDAHARVMDDLVEAALILLGGLHLPLAEEEFPG